MRDVFHLSAFCLVAAIAVTGCKIVPDPDPTEIGSASVGQTDEARMEAFAQENWEARVLPVIQENLVPLDELRAALAENTDAAGEKFGLRPKGEANPWNFAVSGQGKIIEAKLDSRAAKLGVDTTGDGAADVTVQLGPVIRGTALRDAMPFIDFTDFRDQIEFAKLATALNGMAHASTPKPEGDVIGQDLRFEGVFTLRDPAMIELVPVMLEIGG
ncbi:DUF2291 family protein [Paracoccus onubensis]|uniref:DUF2291 domain-containing protein n=1 Tax=Paracoccus onubensis TaxID=1675788 RepID=A0A418T085_9RHOB|nr:DUF2291 domain-containing protein [Paracoccus onubensis]RJE86589.1 DUF2291 domain-containing protein [Paracoccus onubensis]